MLFSLRRFHHDALTASYTNTWVADLAETGCANVYCAPLPADATHSIFCIYPGQRERSFFSEVPFWIFCGTQHVGQARVHDIYPYFEAPHGAKSVYVIVSATLELAKNKLLNPECTYFHARPEAKTKNDDKGLSFKQSASPDAAQPRPTTAARRRQRSHVRNGIRISGGYSAGAWCQGVTLFFAPGWLGQRLLLHTRKWRARKCRGSAHCQSPWYPTTRGGASATGQSAFPGTRSREVFQSLIEGQKNATATATTMQQWRCRTFKVTLQQRR